MAESRGRGLLALSILLLVGAGVLLALRALSFLGLTRNHGAFVVCFEPPRIAAPDSRVRSRVETLDPVLDAAITKTDAPEFLPFVRAIITHESGGDERAVSPTGAAGAVAIAALPEGSAPCCEVDEEDDYRYVYDRCNSEARSGLRCRFDDPRFDADYAVRFAIERFRRIRGLIASGTVDGHAPDSRIVIPLAWNAGLGVFRSFPRGMGSVEAALAQLDFSGKSPYMGFRVHGLANKVVEIYDYLIWFGFLVDYWAGRSPRAPSGPALICFNYSAGGNGIAFVTHGPRPALVRAASVSIEIRRLALGRYEPAMVYFADGWLRSIVWWIAVWN